MENDHMDEIRRIRVAQLATAETRARQRYEALGMVNTSALTTEERIALDVEYALARAEWYEALDVLRSAIEPGPTMIALLNKVGRHYVPH